MKISFILAWNFIINYFSYAQYARHFIRLNGITWNTLFEQKKKNKFTLPLLSPFYRKIIFIPLELCVKYSENT